MPGSAANSEEAAKRAAIVKRKRLIKWFLGSGVGPKGVKLPSECVRRMSVE
jgi:hypothetical protein